MTDTITVSPDLSDDVSSDAGDAPQGVPPEFNLRISSDKVRVLLDCPDPHRDLTSVVGRIVGDLKALELPSYPDEEFITQVLHNICQPGDHVVDAILIMGQAPVPSVSGRLEWSRDYFADVPDGR